MGVYKVHKKIIHGNTRNRGVWIKCPTYQEWCDLLAFAKLAGYDFAGDNVMAERLWMVYNSNTVLYFGYGRCLLYGAAGPNAYNLSDTDLYDIIYPPMDLDGDVMSVIEL